MALVAGKSNVRIPGSTAAGRLLIRWEKKAANYLGLLHFQFAIVALRAAKVLA